MINKIFFGNCFDIIPKLIKKEIKANLIIADLPYNISKNSGFPGTEQNPAIEKYRKHSIDFGDFDKEEMDLKKLSKLYYELLPDNGVVVIFHDIWKSTLVKEAFGNFKQPRVLQWIKSNAFPVNSKLNFLSNASEYFFAFVKKSKPTFNSSYHNGIFTFPICHGKEREKHPTQKPVKLISEIIKIYSNENDLILDNVMGSGTTIISCLENKRNYIGIEKDIKYFIMAKNRIKKYNDK